MKLKQYLLLLEWEACAHQQEWPFPKNASQDFWEFALDHAAVMNAGYVPAILNLAEKVEDALDQYLEKGEPVEWLYWLFGREGAPTPDHEMFHLVYVWADGVPSYNHVLAGHEFTVQGSDQYKGMYEVYDLTEDCAIRIAQTAEEAQGWLDEQLGLAEAIDRYDKGEADEMPDFGATQYLEKGAHHA